MVSGDLNKRQYRYKVGSLVKFKNVGIFNYNFPYEVRHDYENIDKYHGIVRRVHVSSNTGKNYMVEVEIFDDKNKSYGNHYIYCSKECNLSTKNETLLEML